MGVEELFAVFEKPLEKTGEQLEDFINSLNEDHTKRLAEYFLGKKGHRLRPLLCFISYDCARGIFENKKPDGKNVETEQEISQSFPAEAYRRAASLELLHSASLLHDDVIDGETERREQPSVNQLKGNKTAVLLGNIFYLNAFRYIVDPLDMSYYEAMLDTSMNMCEGEILQAEKGETKLTLQEYLTIIEMKTAKLVELSCRFGAATAKVTEETIRQISRLGLILGIFYQVRDDKKDGDAHYTFGEELDIKMERFHMEYVEILDSLKKQGCKIDYFLMIEKMIRPING